MRNTGIYLNALGVHCPLGMGQEKVSEQLFGEPDRTQFLRPHPDFGALPVGAVVDELADVSDPEDGSRNNALLLSAANQLSEEVLAWKQKVGAPRIGVVLGTSTSGIADGEAAMREWHSQGQLPESYRYSMQEPYSPARFLARHFQLEGPAWCVSSACTSGGKALASAARLIAIGACDMVIAGGVDTLCQMTVKGFSSLGVTAETLCTPFAADRPGINIGEAAAVFLVSREHGPVEISGIGESSDAHHISAPHPEGEGSEAAMRAALLDASLAPNDIDYINFHGTGTHQNDQMEGRASARVFGLETACGSTKSLTGHTLGAAGALEAAFCWLSLQRDDGRLPAHCWAGPADPELPAFSKLANREIKRPLQHIMSNSFAFGGNNLSLVLSRA